MQRGKMGEKENKGSCWERLGRCGLEALVPTGWLVAGVGEKGRRGQAQASFGRGASLVVEASVSSHCKLCEPPPGPRSNSEASLSSRLWEGEPRNSRRK